MTAKLDPNTRNNDIGLYWKTSRRVDPSGGGLPWKLPELATGIIASTAGTVVWKNIEGSSEVTPFEAGQWQPISPVEVLIGDTIDGQAETTTATGLFWTASPANMGRYS